MTFCLTRDFCLDVRHQNNRIMKLNYFYALAFLFVASLGSSLFAQVAIRDTTIIWKHHYYELHDDFSMKKYSMKERDIVDEKFDAKVIENEYYRMVIVPGFGGRIISYVYKPNNHEFLYRNPVGTPYLIGKIIFYYDWLMLWGGIFPTFPDGEHGKTWCRAWDLKVEKEQNDSIIVAMSLTDDFSYKGHPYMFQKGYTGITCKVEILAVSGKTSFAYTVTLTNSTSKPKTYEYWTNTAMAPGSDPDNPRATLNTEMVVPTNTVEAAYNQNNWMGLIPLDKANYFHKWRREGIVYAIPKLNGDYWGIINHDNEEGMFRIADNHNHTIGLKFWLWGKKSLKANPNSFYTGGHCPIIELWAGVTRRFWEKVWLESQAQKRWTEYYYPTIGLANISGINNQASLGIQVENTDTLTELIANLMLVQPQREYHFSLSLRGDTTYASVIEEKFIAHPLGNKFFASLNHSNYRTGEYAAEYALYNEQEHLILVGAQTMNLGKKLQD